MKSKNIIPLCTTTLSWILGGMVLWIPWITLAANEGTNIDHELPTVDTGKVYGYGEDLFTIFISYARKFKYIVVISAILFIVIAGVRMITASGNEEISKKNRTSIVWLMVGLIIMQLSEIFVNILYNQDYYMGFGIFGDYAENVPEKLQNSLVNPLLNFMMTLLAVIAVLMILIAALKMMTAMGDEGKIKKQQQMLVGAVLGLGIIVLAKPVVQWFYGYGTSTPSTNVAQSVSIVVQIANFIMGFTFVAAVVMLIVAGIMMVINFGNDQQVQKAKKIISWVLVGLALILSAYTIVLLFIAPQL
jgi:hypothetical protein